ncbi:hypothetical protein [Streptomyces sp. NPDC018045]|uniref:hypothetical protein n=1 Tax=Streptomyces sp. NPDC018045 TaxID=3365037 RepID=UPI0037A1704D
MEEVAASLAPEVPAEEADALPIDVSSIEGTCARALRPRRLLTQAGLAETAQALHGHLKLLLAQDPGALTPLAQDAAQDATRLLGLADCTEAATACHRLRALAQLCLILLEPHRPPAPPAAESGRCTPPAQEGS